MAEHEMHHHPGQSDPQTQGVHGMLLVGQEPIYLSHLPMFMAPHNYQVILKVHLDDEANGTLRNFRAHFGPDSRYTVKPEVFSITDLIPNDTGTAARTSFAAELVKGHFEKGADVIAEHATVHVDEVVHFQELGRVDEKSTDLEYLLFGAGEQFFLAHWITRPPDFDQILAVSVTGHQFTDEELSRELFGVLVTIGERANDVHDRLRSGEKVSGRAHVTGAHQFQDLQVEVLSEVYFEEGELRKRPTFSPTEEEDAAGFGD
jgi:hypothetical protein